MKAEASRVEVNLAAPGVDADFETLWQIAQPKVLAYCFRYLRDVHRAEDVAQKVMFRAWRGYSQFSGEVPVMAWIFKICRREVSREAGRFIKEFPVEPGDEVLVTLPAPEQPQTIPRPSSAEIIAGALNAGEISEFEATILQARTEDPPPSWQELGVRFEQSANACAAAHCRAIPRLRTFIFMRRPEWAGTPAMLREAFGRALSARTDPLLPSEAEAFRMLVLDRGPYRRAGWQTALRSACAKVMDQIQRT
jgi:DNA-directed RNA polymerase specialized sigma24 family protein